MYIAEEKRVKCNEQFLKYFFGNKRQSIKTFVRIFIEKSFVMHSDNQIGYCAFCCYISKLFQEYLLYSIIRYRFLLAPNIFLII